MLKLNQISILFILILVSCNWGLIQEFKLEVPETTNGKFTLDFSKQVEQISWDSIHVVKPYSNPKLNHLKGFNQIKDLNKSDLYILVIYTKNGKAVGYSLVSRDFDLGQLWDESNSSDYLTFQFTKNDAYFSFEKLGANYHLIRKKEYLN